MPLANAPIRGYTDYQRLENWDSGVLFSQTNYNASPSFNISPAIDISRYAYLTGKDQPGGVDTVVTLNWWLDSAATIAMGLRKFVLPGGIVNNAQYRVPNLGPFMTANWFGIGSVNLNHTCALIGTNRVHPLEFVPTSNYCRNDTSVAILASATQTLYPIDYYSGPLHVWGTMSGNSWTITYQLQSFNGAWGNFQQDTVTTATYEATVITPPGGWRIQITNGTAAGQTYSLGANFSLTGSS